MRPALGTFKHEAVAVDTINNHLYLTEDETNGRLYRFRPTNPFPDLTAGTLEVAEKIGGGLEGTVQWLPVPDPSGSGTATRLQVPASTSFNGGEGIAYGNGKIYFVTKGDDRVWCFDVVTSQLTVIYHRASSPTPFLRGVDNVELSVDGDILVAEDGGDLEIVAITPAGTPISICKLVGHAGSEIAGPAFSPDYSKLYFSSQRGLAGTGLGITFELSGGWVI